MERLTDLTSPKDQNRIWGTLSKALGADLREHNSIQGVSGLDHAVQALAVDDKNNRLLVFSAEPNPRVAALVQVDVQAAMPDTRVLVARPVAFDLGVIARKAFKTVDDARFDLQEFKRKVDRIEASPISKKAKERTSKQLEKYIASSLQVFENVGLPALSQIVDVLQQFSHLDWENILSSIGSDPNNPVISFAALMEIDNLAIDRDHGICPLPLYEFSQADWNLMLSGTRIEEVQNRLRELDIYQYFYPAADQIALGVVERGITKRDDVIETIHRAPALGHPLSHSELLPTATDIPRILEELAEHGYVAEGEYGVTMTSKGTTARSKIKFRPREGVIVKLINRFSARFNVSVNPKDFMGP